MNDSQKAKVLAGALVVFLLGMGSSWFVFRNPAPQAANVAQAVPAPKPSRSALADKPEKATRVRRPVVRDRQDAAPKKVRPRNVRESEIKKQRRPKPQSKTVRIDPRAKGC